jgi:YHS domain-containing protein
MVRLVLHLIDDVTMTDSKQATGVEKQATPASVETQLTDPVCGMEVDHKGRGYTRTHEGRNYRFCSLGCVEKFEAQPERFLKPKAR